MTINIRVTYCCIFIKCVVSDSLKRAIDLAEAYGVKVYGMSSNEIGEQKKEPATIILGYANITECEIEQGVQKLLEAWKEYL